MLPRETLATAQVPDGETLTLVSHGRDFIIMLGRDELMGTRMQFSEEQLAELTLAELDAPRPRVLIGGYGMGFTYRAALASLREGGSVTVARIVPDILEWAAGPLAHL
ncbi:MAG: spermidine synthase, partial [Qipengyuania citrea]